MPKVICPCGFPHNLSPIPDEGWVIVRDKDYEGLIRAEMAAAAGDSGQGSLVINLLGRLYECPECGRVMWSLPGARCTTFRIFEPGQVGACAVAGSQGKMDMEHRYGKEGHDMTIKQIEEKVVELIHHEPFIPFAFEMMDGEVIEVPHPRLSVDFTGAGFIGPDGGLVGVEFKDVRSIRLLNREAVA
jgi:hypothetical protein